MYVFSGAVISGNIYSDNRSFKKILEEMIKSFDFILIIRVSWVDEKFLAHSPIEFQPIAL